jgi:pentatricopeptide repeat protein
MLEDKSVKIDVDACNLLLEMFAAQGSLDKIDFYFHHFVNDLKIEPNRKMKITIMRTFGKSSNALAAKKWMTLFSEKYQIPPKVYEMNSVLKAFSNGNDQTGMLQWLQHMREEVKMTPNSATMGIVIHTFAKAGDARQADHWFHVFRDEWGVQPSPIVMNSLISAFAKVGDVKNVLKWLDVTRNDLKIAPTTQLMTTVISCHAKARDSKGAEEWYRVMTEEMQLLPNKYTASALLSSYAASGDVLGAEECLARLEGTGLEVGAYAISSLVHACAVAGDVERASKWLMVLKKTKELDVGVLNSVLDVFASVRDGKAAEKWLGVMRKELGILPNQVSLLSTLFSLFLPPLSFYPDHLVIISSIADLPVFRDHRLCAGRGHQRRHKVVKSNARRDGSPAELADDDCSPQRLRRDGRLRRGRALAVRDEGRHEPHSQRSDAHCGDRLIREERKYGESHRVALLHETQLQPLAVSGRDEQRVECICSSQGLPRRAPLDGENEDGDEPRT